LNNDDVARFDYVDYFSIFLPISYYGRTFLVRKPDWRDFYGFNLGMSWLMLFQFPISYPKEKNLAIFVPL
jgi:hypothetical protein